MSAVTIRQAEPSELQAVTDIFALGFSQDPVWGLWTFPDAADRVPLLQEFWRPYVKATAKYGGVIVTDDLSAVALWVPPETAELDADDEAEVELMLPRVCGDRAPLLEAAWEAFGRSRPETPHWYLSLLATDPENRGRGAGMALVAAQLERVDSDGLPAYLESTNPKNIDRYEQAGFRLDGFFDLPEGPRVDRMWRDGR
jgi:GNAT superfamily N-acetyltransferase